jgi:hypothetical protein
MECFLSTHGSFWVSRYSEKELSDKSVCGLDNGTFGGNLVCLAMLQNLRDRTTCLQVGERETSNDLES